MIDRSGSEPKLPAVTRRDVLKTGTLAAAGALLPLACDWADPPGSSEARPNLVLFMTDDQSWDSIGYETPQVETPHLDNLAHRGMIFRAGHCAAIPCIPSRASTMSGLYHHRWERGPQYGLGRGLKEGTWTWAHALREAGYRTGLFGKMHFRPLRAGHGFDVMQLCDHNLRWEKTQGDPRWRDDYTEWMKAQGREELVDPETGTKIPNGAMQGFEWPHPIDMHPISWVRDRAIEFVQEPAGEGRPFAAIVSFRFPHTPYIPAEPFASMYDPESIEMPVERWEDMEGYVPGLDFEPNRLFNRAGRLPAKPHYQRQVAKYWGLVSQIDAAVGSVVEHLDPSNTLVLFTSDHGGYLGKRGRSLKMPTVPFEALTRVPCFAMGRGVPAGAVYENPVSLVDVAPTFLRAAQLAIPDDLDGRPLQNCFRDPTSGGERPIFCFGGYGFDTVQVGRIKYFRHRDRSDEMLFDLESDPGEWKNLAGDPKWAAARKHLARELDAILSKPAPSLPHFDELSRRV
jgi:uncharacterized sulfatase